MEFSSKFIENAVNEISNLPGIGKKSALRLVLFLLKQPESQSQNLANAISQMRLNVNFCKKCHNISDSDICEICANPRRDESIICVVEDIRDVMAIEKTSSFNGLYHVLGGKISPVDGIGPDDLNISSLVEKVKNNKTSNNSKIGFDSKLSTSSDIDFSLTSNKEYNNDDKIFPSYDVNLNTQNVKSTLEKNNNTFDLEKFNSQFENNNMKGELEEFLNKLNN